MTTFIDRQLVHELKKMQLSKSHRFSVQIVAKAAVIIAAGCVAIVGFVFRNLTTSNFSRSESDELASAIRGGVFNYRTSQFDDGTDPAGWYTLD